MTLISSISGIRGIIGGKTGEGFTPDDVVKYTAAFGYWILKNGKNNKVVVGRDGRITGSIINQIVTSTLCLMGIDVIDAGLSTTPTVEMAVPNEKAGGGVVITASHNPKQWNALKLLNNKGEFISESDGRDILEIINKMEYQYAELDKIGKYEQKEYLTYHIDRILNLPLVDADSIRDAKYKIVVDGINSVGGIAVPQLLKAMGIHEVIEINCTPNGKFAHNPEPLNENLYMLSGEVKMRKADLGIAVDPDVDRLAFVMNNGEFYGEEYTLVTIADYILQHTKGNTVSNLSSTKALKEITEKHECNHYSSAVGEVNVVKLMKDKKAIIGGEGNGGVIYPDLHYGRDALVGIALFLSFMAKSRKAISQLRLHYPNYHISKNKIELNEHINLDLILSQIQEKYKHFPNETLDGLKLFFDEDWVHLRKSNTEPIIRIYSESESQTKAENLAKKIISDIKSFL